MKSTKKWRSVYSVTAGTLSFEITNIEKSVWAKSWKSASAPLIGQNNVNTMNVSPFIRNSYQLFYHSVLYGRKCPETASLFERMSFDCVSKFTERFSKCHVFRIFDYFKHCIRSTNNVKREINTQFKEIIVFNHRPKTTKRHGNPFLTSWAMIVWTFEFWWPAIT